MHMTDLVRELETGLRELGRAIAQAHHYWGLDVATSALIEAHESLWETLDAAAAC